MMPEYEAKPNSNDDGGPSSTDGLVESGNEQLSPMDGGRWRPVSPEELLRRNVPDPSPDDQQERQKVQLERRQELQHKLKTNPTDLDGFLELAAIYREEQRPLEAKRLLKQALQIFPDEEPVRFQYEEAILARSWQQFREVSDLAERLKTPEADRELERSRSDWACRRIDVCRARLERDPSQIGLRLALAEAKYDAELFEDSLEDAGSLIEIDEWSPSAHFLRARCLMAIGEDLPAMKELRAVALRRSVVASDKLRHASLRLLCDLSEKLSLEATGNQYREHLRRLQQASAQKQDEKNS